MEDDLSFWRIGEAGRLERVWRPVARTLKALCLIHSKKATKAIIYTQEARYEYTVSIEENIPRRFKDLDLSEALRLNGYRGRPTLVTITITPSFIKDSERITLKNPYVLVRGYPGLACISAVSPGGTVSAVRQAALTPLRISDIRWVDVQDVIGRMRPSAAQPVPAGQLEPC